MYWAIQKQFHTLKKFLFEFRLTILPTYSCQINLNINVNIVFNNVLSVHCRTSAGPQLFISSTSAIPVLSPSCSSYVLLFCLFCASRTSCSSKVREDLKMPYRGTPLSLFCSSQPCQITLLLTKWPSHEWIFSPERQHGSKTSKQSWFSKISHTCSFRLLGASAMMWAEQTDGAWYD